MYLLYLAVLFLALLQTRASAHEFSCGHDHLSGPEGQVFMQNTCNGEGSQCSSGCYQVTTRNNRAYCSCGNGDCETVFAGTFIPYDEDALKPNTEYTFTLGTETLEALSVRVAEMEVASFGPTSDDTFGPADSEAVYGTATLEFGSFDVATAIPVRVTDLFIEIASLVGDSKESGTTTVQLPDREPISMLYDSVQNRFRLAETGAIALNLDLENGLAGRQPAAMYFEGKFTGENDLAIFGQLVVNMTETAVPGASWGAAKASRKRAQAQKKQESTPGH